MNLKLLRVSNNLNQEEMGLRCGVNRLTYATIEQGVRSGKPEFWKRVQAEFNVDDADMWGLMANE